MTVLERNVEQALRSAADLRWMRGYLAGLLAAGDLDRDTLIEILQTIHDRFRARGDDHAADMVLDGLDLLTDWCGPEMGIPESQTA
jgi:hypothetical protein